MGIDRRLCGLLVLMALVPNPLEYETEAFPAPVRLRGERARQSVALLLAQHGGGAGAVGRGVPVLVSEAVVDEVRRAGLFEGYDLEPMGLREIRGREGSLAVWGGMASRLPEEIGE